MIPGKGSEEVAKYTLWLNIIFKQLIFETVTTHWRNKNKKFGLGLKSKNLKFRVPTVF